MSGAAPAHSPFGGSVAARVLGCPASVGLIAKVPAHLRKPPGIYADRGTALHSAMSRLIEGECSFDDLVGATIDNYTITRDDSENALRPAYNYVDGLLNTPGAEYYLEQRVAFPGVADAFGTADLSVRIGNTIHVIDYKFGTGVRVLALYPDGNEDVINAQPLFYGVGFRHTFPDFFIGVEEIVLTILQPVTTEIDAEMVSSVTVTHAELDAFVAVYRAACEEALGPTPRLARGAHCRFCPARPICPEFTKPLLDLAHFALPARGAPDYFAVLAAGLELLDQVKDLSTELRAQAKQALENGDAVPGFALSAGRAVRSWRDEAGVAVKLLNMGLVRDDVLVDMLRSPKQVEIRAKARGLKIPSEFITSRPSGVSLVRAENAHAPMPGRGEITRSFAEALSAFQKGNVNG